LNFSQEESIVESITVKPNPILFWFTVTFQLTNKRISLTDYNTLLALIPFGKNEITMTLKNVASVSVSSGFSIIRLLVGIILTVFGLNLLFDGIFGIIFLAIGVLYLLK
jgi:hypothetical protein